MDSQDHRKTASSGHENHGVHVCHKCGWPFPNPHPSAKHRRAHKKVCGTIEGYKLTDVKEQPHLVVSDDEHESDQRSDEDRQTPSPKIEKRSTEEGGIGERSNRSQDGVFSDAVSEFPDGGFSPGFSAGIKMDLGIDTNSDKTGEQTVEDNQVSSESVKIDPTTDVTELTKNAIETSQIHIQATTQWEVTTAIEDTTPKTDGLGGMNDSTELSYSKSETTDSAETHKFASEAPRTFEIVKEDVIAELEHGKTVEMIPEKSAEAVSLDNFANEAPGTFEFVKVDKVAELEQGKTNEVIPEKSAEAVSLGCPEASADSVQNTLDSFKKASVVQYHVEHVATDTISSQNKVDSSEYITIGRHDNFIEDSDSEEKGKADMHVVSVGNMSVINHPVAMIEGFKNHEMPRSPLSLTLDSDEVNEVTGSVEDKDKDTLFQGNHSSFASNKLKVEDDHKSESGHDNLRHDLPTEKEAEAPEAKTISDEDVGTNGLEEIPDASSSEVPNVQTNHCHDELGTYSAKNLHSDRVLKHATGQSDLVPIVNSDDAVNLKNDAADAVDVVSVATSAVNQIDHAVRSSGGENTDDHKNKMIEKCAADGNENNIDVFEGKSLPNTQTCYESSESLSMSKVDQPSSMSVEHDAGAHEKGDFEFSFVADKESTEAAAKEEKIIMQSMTHDHSSLSKLQDEDSQDAAKEPGISDETKVQLICGGTVVEVADVNQDSGVEMLEKNEDNSVSKVPGTLPADAEAAFKSPTIIEYSHNTDNTGDASVVGSEPMPQEDIKNSVVKGGSIVSSEPLPEGADKLTQQEVSISALDVSVDSSSQTDSLEGNWGSVSVLSTQSDIAAAVDAETLRSTDSTKAFNSGNASLQKQTTDPEGCHSDKADVFEPPSFMTLVIPTKGGVDQSVAYPEIRAAQNNQQPKSDASQAGWFPSLTNVVNESPGRKKNEEMIARVTNWSTGKQHPALKTLLGEAIAEQKAKLSNQKQMTTETQKDGNETVANNDNSAAETVKVLGSEAPEEQTLKKEMGKKWTSPARYPVKVLGSEPPKEQTLKKEIGKEWNSPARYPADEKKQNKKVKGRTHWVPFVCCSSVN